MRNSSKRNEQKPLYVEVAEHFEKIEEVLTNSTGVIVGGYDKNNEWRVLPCNFIDVQTAKQFELDLRNHINL